MKPIQVCPTCGTGPEQNGIRTAAGAIQIRVVKDQFGRIGVAREYYLLAHNPDDYRKLEAFLERGVE